MKNLAITALAIAAALSLGACQSSAVLKANLTWVEPDDLNGTYNGKEFPGGHFNRALSETHDTGHDLRGFHIGQRHWDF